MLGDPVPFAPLLLDDVTEGGMIGRDAHRSTFDQAFGKQVTTGDPSGLPGTHSWVLVGLLSTEHTSQAEHSVGSTVLATESCMNTSRPKDRFVPSQVTLHLLSGGATRVDSTNPSLTASRVENRVITPSLATLCSKCLRRWSQRSRTYSDRVWRAQQHVDVDFDVVTVSPNQT